MRLALRSSTVLVGPFILSVGLLAACGDDEPTPTPVVVEKEVIKEVIVPATPEVIEKEVVRQVVKEVELPVEKEVIVVVTPTPTPTATPTATPPPQPKVWRIGMPEDITTTNIWAFLGPDVTAFNLYVNLDRYPALYRLSDKRFDWVPSLADGFPTEFVQEGDLWTTTVKLQEGAVWSDGEPITAEDVAFTISTALEPKLPGNWASHVDPASVDHVEALGVSTLKYYFKSIPGLARWQFGLSVQQFVAQHFWGPLVEQAKQAGETVEEQQAALYAIVPEDEPTAGEMLFVKWEPGGLVEVRANDRYFFKDSTVTKYANGAYMEVGPSYTSGPWYGEAAGDVELEFTRGPYADSVIFSIYSSLDTLVLALRAGEIDSMLSPSGLQRGLQEQLRGEPDISVLSNAPNSIHYLGFNVRRPPMDDQAFRQAVALLIDKEFITGTVLQGVADAAYTLVPPGNGFWYNPDVLEIGKGLSRQERIAQAVALLKDAGYTWDTEPQWDADGGAVNPEGAGLRMPNGELVPKLGLLAPSAGSDPLRATFAVWIERWLNEAGIPVTAQLKGLNVLIPKLFFEQDMDMWVLAWGLGIFPDYLNDFFNSSRAGLGDFNLGGYSNPEFGALAEQLVAETDITKARAQAFRLQEIVAQELPYVVLETTQILEPFRSSMRLPFTEVVDGFQKYFQNASGPLAYTQVE